MILTCRYKLKPSRAQYRQLETILEMQRQLYNAALQERVDAWRTRKLTVTRLDQNRSLTRIRADDPVWAALPVALSRWPIARVDDAMRAFFARVKRGQKPGFPRFKPATRWKSFGFVEFSGIRLRDGRLYFSGITGGLRLDLHRPLPPGADLKSCVFKRSGRHWHVSFAADVTAAESHARPDSAIGLDVGVAHLATTSDSVHIPNRRPGTRRARELRRAQRALARCRKGSNRRRKTRETLARLQRAISNARDTYLHQVSAALTRDHAFIAVEKLQLKNLTRSAKGTPAEPGTNVRQKAGLNRSLLDAAPGRLIAFLSYKAARAGGTLMAVDPRNSSQECHACGATVVKSLSQRRHVCACGADLDRDHNAALVILRRALAAHGRAQPPGDGNVGHRAVRRPGTAVADAA